MIKRNYNYGDPSQGRSSGYLIVDGIDYSFSQLIEGDRCEIKVRRSIGGDYFLTCENWDQVYTNLLDVGQLCRDYGGKWYKSQCVARFKLNVHPGNMAAFCDSVTSYGLVCEDGNLTQKTMSYTVRAKTWRD